MSNKNNTIAEFIPDTMDNWVKYTYGNYIIWLSGDNNKEIYNYLIKKYGDFILLKPALKINTIVLWFLPFVLLLIGAFFIYRHNKKSETSH